MTRHAPFGADDRLADMRAEKALRETLPTPKPPPRKPSAAERTVALPGVDVREQWDRNEIHVDGPKIRAVPVDGHTKHYGRVGELRTLCGRIVNREEDIGRPTCQACHIEASKIGAVLE